MAIESCTRQHGTTYDDGFFRLEHDYYHVTCGGRELSLRRTEFLILSCLTSDEELAVEPRALWKCIWGDAEFKTRRLNVHLFNLRRALDGCGIILKHETNVAVSLSFVHNADSPVA